MDRIPKNPFTFDLLGKVSKKWFLFGAIVLLAAIFLVFVGRHNDPEDVAATPEQTKVADMANALTAVATPTAKVPSGDGEVGSDTQGDSVWNDYESGFLGNEASVGNAPSYSLKEIADDYISEKFELAGYYTEVGDGWLRIDETNKAFKIGAVLPYEEWDTEKIMKAALDTTVPWVTLYSSTKYLWSRDYEHEFVVKDYTRLYIDGDYVGDAPHKVHDMDPLSLIEYYQAGSWDGETRLWSEDGSTCVTVLKREENETDHHLSGCLEYQFFNRIADTPQKNGELYVYGDPWWDAEDNSYEFKRESFARTENDLTEVVTYDEIIVTLNVNLPNGQLTAEDGYGEVMKAIPCGEYGTLVLTTEGGWLFKRGKATAWPATPAEQTDTTSDVEDADG